jgi:alginate O-acetyltransferase complex protein AlgI
MLFNSHEFLLVFLPATLLGFYLIGRASRQAAILWLIVASLIFYGWWRPLNILIIGPSIIVNYLLASFLLRLSQRDDQPGLCEPHRVCRRPFRLSHAATADPSSIA